MNNLLQSLKKQISKLREQKQPIILQLQNRLRSQQQLTKKLTDKLLEQRSRQVLYRFSQLEDYGYLWTTKDKGSCKKLLIVDVTQLKGDNEFGIIGVNKFVSQTEFISILGQNNQALRNKQPGLQNQDNTQLIKQIKNLQLMVSHLRIQMNELKKRYEKNMQNHITVISKVPTAMFVKNQTLSTPQILQHESFDDSSPSCHKKFRSIKEEKDSFDLSLAEISSQTMKNSCHNSGDTKNSKQAENVLKSESLPIDLQNHQTTSKLTTTHSQQLKNQIVEEEKQSDVDIQKSKRQINLSEVSKKQSSQSQKQEQEYKPLGRVNKQTKQGPQNKSAMNQLKLTTFIDRSDSNKDQKLENAPKRKFIDHIESFVCDNNLVSSINNKINLNGNISEKDSSRADSTTASSMVNNGNANIQSTQQTDKRVSMYKQQNKQQRQTSMSIPAQQSQPLNQSIKNTIIQNPSIQQSFSNQQQKVADSKIVNQNSNISQSLDQKESSILKQEQKKEPINIDNSRLDNHSENQSKSSLNNSQADKRISIKTNNQQKLPQLTQASSKGPTQVSVNSTLSTEQPNRPTINETIQDKLQAKKTQQKSQFSELSSISETDSNQNTKSSEAKKEETVKSNIQSNTLNSNQEQGSKSSSSLEALPLKLIKESEGQEKSELSDHSINHLSHSIASSQNSPFQKNKQIRRVQIGLNQNTKAKQTVQDNITNKQQKSKEETNKQDKGVRVQGQDILEPIQQPKQLLETNHLSDFKQLTNSYQIKKQDKSQITQKSDLQIIRQNKQTDKNSQLKGQNSTIKFQPKDNQDKSKEDQKAKQLVQQPQKIIASPKLSSQPPHIDTPLKSSPLIQNLQSLSNNKVEKHQSMPNNPIQPSDTKIVHKEKNSQPQQSHKQVNPHKKKNKQDGEKANTKQKTTMNWGSLFSLSGSADKKVEKQQKDDIVEKQKKVKVQNKKQLSSVQNATKNQSKQLKQLVQKQTKSYEKQTIQNQSNKKLLQKQQNIQKQKQESNYSKEQEISKNINLDKNLLPFKPVQDEKKNIQQFSQKKIQQIKNVQKIPIQDKKIQNTQSISTKPIQQSSKVQQKVSKPTPVAANQLDGINNTLKSQPIISNFDAQQASLETKNKNKNNQVEKHLSLQQQHQNTNAYKKKSPRTAQKGKDNNMNWGSLFSVFGSEKKTEKKTKDKSAHKNQDLNVNPKNKEKNIQLHTSQPISQSKQVIKEQKISNQALAKLQTNKQSIQNSLPQIKNHPQNVSQQSINNKSVNLLSKDGNTNIKQPIKQQKIPPNNTSNAQKPPQVERSAPAELISQSKSELSYNQKQNQEQNKQRLDKQNAKKQYQLKPMQNNQQKQQKTEKKSGLAKKQTKKKKKIQTSPKASDSLNWGSLFSASASSTGKKPQLPQSQQKKQRKGNQKEPANQIQSQKEIKKEQQKNEASIVAKIGQNISQLPNQAYNSPTRKQSPAAQDSSIQITPRWNELSQTKNQPSKTQAKNAQISNTKNEQQQSKQRIKQMQEARIKKQQSFKQKQRLRKQAQKEEQDYLDSLLKEIHQRQLMQKMSFEDKIQQVEDQKLTTEQKKNNQQNQQQNNYLLKINNEKYNQSNVKQQQPAKKEEQKQDINSQIKSLFNFGVQKQRQVQKYKKRSIQQIPKLESVKKISLQSSQSFKNQSKNFLQAINDQSQQINPSTPATPFPPASQFNQKLKKQTSLNSQKLLRLVSYDREATQNNKSEIPKNYVEMKKTSSFKDEEDKKLLNIQKNRGSIPKENEIIQEQSKNKLNIDANSESSSSSPQSRSNKNSQQIQQISKTQRPILTKNQSQNEQIMYLSADFSQKSDKNAVKIVPIKIDELYSEETQSPKQKMNIKQQNKAQQLKNKQIKIQNQNQIGIKAEDQKEVDQSHKNSINQIEDKKQNDIQNKKNEEIKKQNSDKNPNLNPNNEASANKQIKKPKSKSKVIYFRKD